VSPKTPLPLFDDLRATPPSAIATNAVTGDPRRRGRRPYPLSVQERSGNNRCGKIFIAADHVDENVTRPQNTYRSRSCTYTHKIKNSLLDTLVILSCPAVTLTSAGSGFLKGNQGLSPSWLSPSLP
jgi:hypothetical protein